MENDKYEKQDIKSRLRFIDDFKPYFKKVEQTALQAHIDIQATGLTGMVYRVEIKERFYPTNFFMDNPPIMMERKYYEFRSIFKYRPDITSLYFLYTTDGYISFNITNRFKNNSPDLTLTRRMVQDSIFEEGKAKPRKCCYLQFNPEMGDKIRYFNTNN